MIGTQASPLQSGEGRGPHVATGVACSGVCVWPPGQSRCSAGLWQWVTVFRLSPRARLMMQRVAQAPRPVDIGPKHRLAGLGAGGWATRGRE